MVIRLIKKLVPLKIKFLFRDIILATLGLSSEDIRNFGSNDLIIQSLDQKLTSGDKYNYDRVSALEKKMKDLDDYYFKILYHKIESDHSVLMAQLKEDGKQLLKEQKS